MGPLVLFLGFLTSQALAANVDVSPQFEPMVAFVCKKPNMFMTEKGWLPDTKNSCFEKPQDILKYCKEKYPDYDITNVVPASDKVTISDWCKFGVKHCHTYGTHTVKPWRCLVGPFQSEALLVPEECNFDHLHNSKQCVVSEDWNKIATESCRQQGKVIQSFAMLLPCGVAKYNGVEFVCCPSEKAQKEKKEKHTHEKKEKAKEHKSNSVQSSTETPENDYYKYMHNGNMDKYLNEHEKFKAAEKSWSQIHQEGITRMMKDWAEAREQVQQMKGNDPRGADAINKEITERFQKTYSAFEQEGMAEKKQLVALHQQHVQVLFNEKRRKAIEQYTDSLMQLEPEATSIIHALKHLIKVEEKDRQHTVNHFKHVQDTDPVEADRIRAHTIEHLKTISTRINQTIAMLHRLPKFEKKIKEIIADYMEDFEDIDKSIEKVFSKATFSEEKEAVKTYKEDLGKDYNKIMPDTKKEQKRPIVKPKKQSNEIPKPMKIDDGGLEPKITEVKPVKIKKVKQVKIIDDETEENEHAYIDLKPKVMHAKEDHVAHQGQDAIALQQQDSIHIQPVTGVGAAQQASTLGIAIGCVTVFVVIVVAVVLLRKKSRRVPIHHDFVDEAQSPEERHVANMQINGYENPTYTYFETST
ncbi:unnamed protein product [Owenia fusiformis]|uniref:Uncharacterized protein n=1 Tax=Owenia fusiformis TaxID=6347 RepID=A0A8S4PUB6_OWEFU|nr:unnamed protein product [Owenia fusiformis]